MRARTLPLFIQSLFRSVFFGRWISTHQGVSILNNTPQLHRYLPSDEIDLFELFGAIWKQKNWSLVARSWRAFWE